MSAVFSDFFSLLEYELQQTAEDGDATSAESYKLLPKTYAKIYTNESIRELIDLNPMKFWQEDSYIFESNTHVFDLPDNWAYFIAYYNSSDTEHPRWTMVEDASNTDATVRIVSPRRIYNSTGWTQNEEIFVRVVRYPDPVVDDTDLVEFEDSSMRLLRLHIIQKAYGNKGKAMPAELTMELNTKMQQFIQKTTPIKTQRYFSFRGKNMGRRS
jgi:hypothetical protein